jgi:adenylate cyclase class 2
MLEIEIKARVDRPKALREAIRRKGGLLLGKEVQEDRYFRHPSRDFSETDEALRIRRVGRAFSLTYKGPKIDPVTKTREEIETSVGDGMEAGRILEKLGFQEEAVVRKERERYRLGEFHVMVDRVEGVGDFVEVEKEGSSYTPEELVEFLASLGIGKGAIERRSYLELLLKAEKGR